MRAVLPAILLWSSVAHATYSIVGSDRDRRQVGLAVTSCVPGSVSVVSGSAPGHGIVAAQARINLAGRDEAARLLGQGTPAPDVVRAIAQASFDGSFEQRQYGVVDLEGRAAAFTGAQCSAHASDRQGTAGAYAYSVQGNILTSRNVIDQAAAAFEGQGCDLAERLMLALEAGARNGEGDARCRPSRPGSSAYLVVDEAGGPAGGYLELDVVAAPGDPVAELRARYDAWRAQHPCPQAGDAGAPEVAGDAGAPTAPARTGGCALASGAPPAALLPWAGLLLVSLAACRRA